MSAKTDEFYQEMTDKVIAAIETAIETGWNKPWVAIFGNAGLPTNAVTKKAYQGGNAIVFMFLGAAKGYASNLWATYRQWETLGGQVRKGEKGTQGVKWVVSFTCQTCSTKGAYPCARPGHDSRKSMFPSVFTVFNYAQQDGYEADLAEMPDGTERLDNIEEFLAATGANIVHAAQDSAYFTPGTNNIVLPLRETFLSTEGYYATALHEVTHWSGDEARLGRDLKNLFGSEKYAAEELVAEFGAIFLQAHFGTTPEPSANSASYLKGWLRALRADSSNLYKAAKAAQEAVNYLLGLQTQAETAGALEDALAA